MKHLRLLSLLVQDNSSRIKDLVGVFSGFGSELKEMGGRIGKVEELALEVKSRPVLVPRDGRDGENGKSAYDIWLESNEGAVEDFLNSLTPEAPNSIEDVKIVKGELVVTLTGGDKINAGKVFAGFPGGGGGNALKVKQEVLATIQSPAYRIVSDDYTTIDEDVYMEQSVADKTVTLHTPTNNQVMHIDNSSDGTCDVTPVRGSLLVLQPNEGTYLVYNGTEWRIK